MLGELRVIVQRVSAANDLDTALSIIVSCVRETLHTNVSSVYLLDTDVDGYVPVSYTHLTLPTNLRV